MCFSIEYYQILCFILVLCICALVGHCMNVTRSRDAAQLAVKSLSNQCVQTKRKLQSLRDRMQAVVKK